MRNIWQCLNSPIAIRFLRILFFLFIVLYLYLGTAEFPPSVAQSYNDLVAHCLGYIALMGLGILALPKREHHLPLFIVLFGFSFLIECIQYFLPWRSFSGLDMLANGTGLVIGWLLGFVFIKLTKLRGES